MKNSPISSDLFHFLLELRENNHRDWFMDNKKRYEEQVRDPFLQFVADLEKPLLKVSPYLVVDPRPVGGSMFRIYRDVRFSKDKSPYKTNIAAHFEHIATTKSGVSSPGFYVSLQPGGGYAAGGVYHPDRDTLSSIRKAIADRSRDWKKACSGLELQGESLQKPPRGYAADHPFIEDIKFKDFITSFHLTEDEVCQPGFVRKYVDCCRKINPLNRFLASALELPW